ncbi:MAG: alanine--tRNA ligase [Acidobacteriota bacterium]|nr:alanine--tRNA ligase [Acidobacteriota bacterium]MDH3784226.1 alanine--tRNA ligase [Acidobacteriota bacterium]
MEANKARRAFIDYFVERQHQEVASSPVVLPDDATLLFVNAGMNQFKDVFTGRRAASSPRAVSSQKCLRVSGKHNDLEMVGRTPRHHTFFEMLGNFSFGDYFKKDAIAFAWELITKVYGLPPERLWVSVFEGTDCFEADDEALRIWRDDIGVDPDRILKLGEEENFWRMGETGPCGPCSEIHVDLGDELTSVSGPSNPATDERRFLEIWNLVFMQFNQCADGARENLPAPSIDTGMGLERIVSVLQGKQSNYDTDIFAPLLNATAERCGTRYGKDPETDFSIRVIADHARAFAFLVAEGVVPANDRRGYVLRRLLRRAIRHGRKLGIHEPFLRDVTPVVVEQMGDVYPELLASKDALLQIGDLEERRFADTLSTGLQMLDDKLGALGTEKDAGDTPLVLPAKDLFLLYDTFGFPLDLARDIADERGIQLDEEGFKREMARQRDRARASWKGGGATTDTAAYEAWSDQPSTEFLGYDRLAFDDSRVLGILSDGTPIDTLVAGQTGELLLASTAFYGEAGGQIADQGMLAAENGRAQVTDVVRRGNGLFVHRVVLEEGAIAIGDRVRGDVTEERRAAIKRNHTATHLLHAALRDVIGTHVKQAGSRVGDDRFRFDFTHFAPVTPEALSDIESLINRQVLADVEIETKEMDVDSALELGAMALFGEKYGSRVRVVSIGDFSLELCGGTHTTHTGEIGLIKLLEERGVASGTRRVEAVSGEGALDRFRAVQGILSGLEAELSVPADALRGEIERRLGQLRDLQKQLDQQRVGAIRDHLDEIAGEAVDVEGVRVVARRVDGLSPQDMREVADALRGKLGSGVVVLGRAVGGKASLMVAVTEDLRKNLPAGALVKELARKIGGGGGGRPDLAEAGGKQPEHLDAALAAAADEVRRKLS